jgi:hypothetical protein
MVTPGLPAVMIGSSASFTGVLIVLVPFVPVSFT